MRFIVAKRDRISLAILGVFVSVVLPLLWFAPNSSAQDSTVAATVCQTASTINLAQPTSDSTVTETMVPLAGTVNQANQIEIYIDEVFDSVIPLAVGQTNFTGSVQITQGTHTIKVVAINVCPGANGSSSSIVTYEPPPDTTPSNGGETPTNVEEEGETVVATAGGEISESGTGGQSFPEQLSIPFQRFLGWLNINTADTTEGQSLSPWRAVVIGSGLYLLVVGVATTAIQMIASVPVVTAILPSPTAAGRIKWVSWGFRGVGLLMVLGGFFL